MTCPELERLERERLKFGPCKGTWNFRSEREIILQDDERSIIHDDRRPQELRARRPGLVLVNKATITSPAAPRLMSILECGSGHP